MSIIKKPIVTEKATSLNEQGRYALEVERTDNKVEIKKAIEKLYGVTVVAVNTIRSQGKLKSRFTKTGAVTGRRASSKKAIVTVKEGEIIDFYSGI